MNESRFKVRQKNFFEVAVSIVLRTSKLPRKKITASVTETIYFRTLTAHRSAHKAAICEGSLRHYKNQSKTNSLETWSVTRTCSTSTKQRASRRASVVTSGTTLFSISCVRTLERMHSVTAKVNCPRTLELEPYTRKKTLRPFVEK